MVECPKIEPETTEEVMRKRPEAGFTLVELMVVVVIIGVLAAVAIPSYVSMMDRAREGSTKVNMHTFQLSAEDYSIQNNGTYAATAGAVISLIPPAGVSFINPFKRTDPAATDAAAWIVPQATGSVTPGVVAYQDSLQMRYQIAGRGRKTDLGMVLSSGQ